MSRKPREVCAETSMDVDACPHCRIDFDGMGELVEAHPIGGHLRPTPPPDPRDVLLAVLVNAMERIEKDWHHRVGSMNACDPYTVAHGALAAWRSLKERG